MHPGLQRFGGFVERRSGVAGIGAGAGLKAVVGDRRRAARVAFGVGQIADRVARRAPGQQGRRLQAARAGGEPRRHLAFAAGRRVAFPIIAARLVPQQRVARVRLRGKRPARVDVASKTDEHHALAPLRHAEIGGVEHAVNHAVGERLRAAPPPRHMALQPAEMVLPALLLAADQFGEADLVHDIGEIAREAGAREPLDVFEDEGARLYLAQRARRLRPHVARVAMGAMLAAERKRLTGRPAGDQIDLAGNIAKIHVADVALQRLRPARQRRRGPAAVFAKRVAAPSVPFDDAGRRKTGRAHAEPEALRLPRRFRRRAWLLQKSLNLFVNCSLSRNSHSQTTRMRQPAAASAA